MPPSTFPHYIKHIKSPGKRMDYMSITHISLRLHLGVIPSPPPPPPPPHTMSNILQAHITSHALTII